MARFLAALCAALLLAPAAHAQKNPLFKAKPASADPEIALFAGTYYLTSTRSNRIRTSTDLRTWRESGLPMFAKGGGPQWARDTKVYGPKIYFSTQINKYVLLFNGVHASKGRHCIGRAISDVPYAFTNDGRETFNPKSPASRGPLECENGRGGLSPSAYSLIDQSIFQDPRDSRFYLLYKRDFPAAGGRTKDIVIRPISPDFKALGKPKPILTAQAGTWEDGTGVIARRNRAASVEAPKMIYRPATDRYYLFYSGGNFKTDAYAVGVAASETAANSPMGTFRKYFANPILRGAGDPDFCGVGSADVLQLGNDTFGLFYHAYLNERPDGTCVTKDRGRFLMSDAITWDQAGGPRRAGNFWPRVNDGTPTGNGTPLGKLQPAP